MTQHHAEGFRISAVSNSVTEMIVSLYDSNMNSANVTIEILPNTMFTNYSIGFNLFSDLGVNVTSINAIVLALEGSNSLKFTLDEFVAYGPIDQQISKCISGKLSRGQMTQYSIIEIEGVSVGEYLSLNYSASNEIGGSANANFYVIASNSSAGPSNYDYFCNGTCLIQIVWSSLQNSVYNFAVEAVDSDFVYSVCMNTSFVPVSDLPLSVVTVVENDQRPTLSYDNPVSYYHYYSIDIPAASSGYLVVNISRIFPFYPLRLQLAYESLPISPENTGVIGQIDYNSNGVQVDNDTSPFCFNYMSYSRTSCPVDYVPCECAADLQILGTAFQLTCQFIVDACHLQQGNWYVSVELPPRSNPFDPADPSGAVNYNIVAFLDSE